MKHIIFILLLAPFLILGQENVTTFGIQIKPIIPIKLFVDNPGEFVDSNYTGSMTSTAGYSFGMVIRKGLTKAISFESGINFVKRNYSLTMAKQTDSVRLEDETDFGFVSYNIPIQALVYVKLTEHLFMNVSTGVSLNGYASPTVTVGRDLKMEQLTFPRKRAGISYLANLGFEFRTKKDGYFYLGASYSMPLGWMARTRSRWVNKFGVHHDHNYELTGQYLTLDLRYFFHEDPKKKSKKKKAE